MRTADGHFRPGADDDLLTHENANVWLKKAKIQLFTQ